MALEVSLALVCGRVKSRDSRNVELLLSSSAVHFELLLPWVSRDHRQQMQKADHLYVRPGSEALVVIFQRQSAHLLSYRVVSELFRRGGPKLLFASMHRCPRLSHQDGEVERFQDVCDLWTKLNFGTIASTRAEIEPVPSIYARQAHGMRLEDKVFIACDEVPSSPSITFGGAFLY